MRDERANRVKGFVLKMRVCGPVKQPIRSKRISSVSLRILGIKLNHLSMKSLPNAGSQADRQTDRMLTPLCDFTRQTG
jgi:hypothetical protein